MDSGRSVSSILDTMLAALSDSTSQLSDAREIRLRSEGSWLRGEGLDKGTGVLRSGISSSSFLWFVAGTEEKIVKS